MLGCKFAINFIYLIDYIKFWLEMLLYIVVNVVLKYYHNYDKIMINIFWREMMLNIRPVSDLRNKFTEIEKIVKKGEPVYLTKNGYGSMVVMSVDAYDNISFNEIEKALDEADVEAANSDKRLTRKEVFTKIKSKINANKNKRKR